MIYILHSYTAVSAGDFPLEQTQLKEFVLRQCIACDSKDSACLVGIICYVFLTSGVKMSHQSDSFFVFTAK